MPDINLLGWTIFNLLLMKLTRCYLPSGRFGPGSSGFPCGSNDLMRSGTRYMISASVSRYY